MHRILRICSVGFFRTHFVHSVNSVRIRFFDRMNRILRIVFVGFRTIRLHFVNSVQKISHARKNAWLSSDLPSAALPASGSRGSSTTSQPSGSPAIFHAKLRLEEPKSTRERLQKTAIGRRELYGGRP